MYTISNLRNDLKHFNMMILQDLGHYYINEQGRNGYQATDLIEILPDGSERCNEMIGGGTSKEVKSYSEEAYWSIRNKIPKKPKLTRAQCKKMLEINGYDFSLDYHKQPLSLSSILVDMAKASGYRKPQQANGSLARYFYTHLQKRV